LIYATAEVVTETLGFSSWDQKTPQKPGLSPWMWQLQNNLTSLRRDLSRHVAVESGHLKAQGILDGLHTKYLVKEILCQ